MIFHLFKALALQGPIHPSQQLDPNKRTKHPSAPDGCPSAGGYHLHERRNPDSFMITRVKAYNPSR